jgi:hypothetical protein
MRLQHESQQQNAKAFVIERLQQAGLQASVLGMAKNQRSGQSKLTGRRRYGRPDDRL